MTKYTIIVANISTSSSAIRKFLSLLTEGVFSMLRSSNINAGVAVVECSDRKIDAIKSYATENGFYLKFVEINEEVKDDNEMQYTHDLMYSFHLYLKKATEQTNGDMRQAFLDMLA